MTVIKFKGWDWTEIIEYFHKSKNFDYKKPKKKDLPDECSQEYEDKLIKHFQDWTLYYTEEFRNNKNLAEICEPCRAFTQKIAKDNNGYYGPLWQGLHDITDDDTFLNCFFKLLKDMWT